jgi:hypothetical protein
MAIPRLTILPMAALLIALRPAALPVTFLLAALRPAALLMAAPRLTTRLMAAP